MLAFAIKKSHITFRVLAFLIVVNRIPAESSNHARFGKPKVSLERIHRVLSHFPEVPLVTKKMNKAFRRTKNKHRMQTNISLAAYLLVGYVGIILGCLWQIAEFYVL